MKRSNVIFLVANYLRNSKFDGLLLSKLNVFDCSSPDIKMNSKFKFKIFLIKQDKFMLSIYFYIENWLKNS